jgi:hypothetical protein
MPFTADLLVGLGGADADGSIDFASWPEPAEAVAPSKAA